MPAARPATKAPTLATRVPVVLPAAPSRPARRRVTPRTAEAPSRAKAPGHAPMPEAQDARDAAGLLGVTLVTSCFLLAALLF